jgi:hypothetical protein
VIGTTSLTSGASPEIRAEEVISLKGFGTYFVLRVVFVIIPNSLKKKFKKVLLNEPKCLRLYYSDCECEAKQSIIPPP